MSEGKVRACKDCEPGSKRPAPHPGPRCATHHRAVRKLRSRAGRERRVIATYGLAPGQWDQLFEAQGGKCWICQRYKARAVDHDHACCPGKTSCGRCVRGLLCGTCNTMLGRQGDKVETFRRAADYLENPPAKAVLGGIANGDPASEAELQGTPQAFH